MMKPKKRLYWVNVDIGVDASSSGDAVDKVDRILSEGWISGEYKSNIKGTQVSTRFSRLKDLWESGE